MMIGTWKKLLRDTSNGWPEFYKTLFVRDCGSQGDCLFYCIAVLLQNERQIRSSPFYKALASGSNAPITMSVIRNWLSLYVTTSTLPYFLLLTLQDVILIHPDAHMAKKFLPLIGFDSVSKFQAQITNSSELKRVITSKQWTALDVLVVRKLIQTSGYDYQGTELSLFFLREFFKTRFGVNIGFVALGQTPETVSMMGDSETTHFLLLFNQSNYHWLLVGVQENPQQHVYQSVIPRQLLGKWFPKGHLMTKPILF
jgi:hypothetical protein